ncbi:glycerate kinase type-2 family protein [Sphingobium agri]|uniref:Glycerate kinase n=1 Tax=Sphingobium agri TaxID=2933566 RepID=A0ABT0DSZ5_9SPHN|nr:glycerate kinase [Sphingobium agri]MCK0530144.1 glycerate kinase [Sphingobium agri]
MTEGDRGKVARIALAREMFDVALTTVSAERCLPSHLPPPPEGRRLVLAVGKAGAAMASVALRHSPPGTQAIVLIPYDHGLPPGTLPADALVIEAGHPLPDQHGLHAAQMIQEAVRDLGEQDQLLALISGGGSALLALPVDGVSLDDKRRVTRELLLCGATISQINCVRTHLSQVKGGRLAALAHPAEVVTLAFSDVPGDDPALIASGPTVADRTTLEDARRVIERYRITVPDNVMTVLNDDRHATPRPGSPELARADTRIVARNRMALEAAGEVAAAAGYRPVYLGDDLEGDATELGIVHAALALHHQRKGGRWALLSGGETTVLVGNPSGRGGRNSEYMLSLAMSLDAAPGISALACDTDGIDGVGGHAGAIADESTLARARAAGLSASGMLRENNSFGFFEALGDLLFTGPTRTNVNDFRAILIDG